jgi:small subunit ribosomal protein S10e
MVLVPKANKRAILEYLFKEGVLTCKKDGYKAKHDDIDVPNLHVMMVMKSMVSQDKVVEKFNWQWFYYFLTNEGIEFLRAELNLPAQVMPATLTKQTKARQGGDDDGEGRKGGKGKGGGWGKGKGKGAWGKGKGGYGGDGEKDEKPAEE